jgi:hypothetical protein
MCAYPITTSLRVIKEVQYVKELVPGVTPTNAVFTAIPTAEFVPVNRERSVKYAKLGNIDITKGIHDVLDCDVRIRYAPMTLDPLFESMVKLTGPNNREDTYTFLFSQEHNEGGSLVEKYQIARGCKIATVNIAALAGAVINVSAIYMATSISDWTLAHGLTNPIFAAEITDTPWSAVDTGPHPLLFEDLDNGDTYDIRRVNVMINHNLERLRILNADRTLRINSGIRDINLDIDLVWKDTQVSESVKTFNPQAMQMKLNTVLGEQIITTILTFTNALLESYQEALEAENRRIKTVNYLGTADSVDIGIETIGGIITASSVQKYHMGGIVLSQSIQKHFILNTVPALTSIHKYDIRGFPVRTSIHKYNTTNIVLQTSTHKYDLQVSGTVFNESIHKYNLAKYVSQTSIQKYDLAKYISQTNIQKYNLLKEVSQTSIQKYDLTGVPAGPTRLYLHQATDSTTGLPTTEQSSLTATVNFDPLTTNRSMTTTIGTTAVLKSLSTPNSVGPFNMYFGRFVSPALNMTSIAAATWSYNFATRESTASVNFPVGSADNLPVRVNCYIWRPSSSTKIGTILDGNTASTVQKHGSGHFSNHVEFTGAGVGSMASGDRIIFEVWFIVTQASAAVRSGEFTIDGATVTLTDDTFLVASGSTPNHASFIETTQGLIWL